MEEMKLMNLKGKKIGSLFLSVCISVTMLPTAAFSEISTKNFENELKTRKVISDFMNNDKNTENEPSSTEILSVSKSFATPTYAAAPAIGYSFSQGGFSYEVTEITSPNVSVAVYGNSGTSGNIVIPETITYEGTTYNVTGISENAFTGNTNIVSVEIPNSVKKIANWAFANCYNLSEISFGSSIKSIETHAFYSCTSLTEVNLPDSVEEIGISAFEESTSLETITFERTDIPQFGSDAFKYVAATVYVPKESLSGYTTALTAIGFEVTILPIGSLVGKEFSNNGIMYKVLTDSDSEKTISVMGMVYDNVSDVSIPDSINYENKTFSVTEISAYAFSFNNSIRNFTIGSSVTKIGKEAFYFSRIETITFMGNIPPYFSENSFNRLGDLEYVYVQEGRINAYDEAVQAAGWYGYVLAIGSLEHQTFSLEGLKYEVLTDIEGDRTVTVTGYTDRSLESISIPDSVDYKNKTFYVTEIYEYAFSDCRGLASIDLGNSVKKIGSFAFGYCTSLVSITIPASVNELSSMTFRGCELLNEIIFKGIQPPDMQSDTFWNEDNLNNIYVPVGSLNAYKTAIGESSGEDIASIIKEGSPTPGEFLGVVVGKVAVTTSNADNITGNEISGQISYNKDTNTLTLNNASVLYETSIKGAIYSNHDLNVNLIGNSTLGYTIDEDYSIYYGINAEGQTVTIDGTGSLTIFDQHIGVLGKNVNINTVGTIEVNERGDGLSCCLKADGGTLTVNSGTLILTSKISNALYGDSIVINGGTITAISKNLENFGLYAFNNVPLLNENYKYKIYAGKSASSAKLISTVTSATFTESKYVKIAPEGTGGGSGGGSGSGGGGSSSTSSGSGSSKTVTTEDKAPSQPITSVANLSALKGEGSTASVTITNQTITSAVAKAKASAKTNGKAENGISVELNVAMPNGTTSISAVFSEETLNTLVSEGVASLKISGSPVAITFDKKALAEIKNQAVGDISITISPNANLSALAKQMIGTRPVYDLTLKYVKDGEEISVSNFGGGTVIVSVPYIPQADEVVGGLFAVYVDENGTPTKIAGSIYDADSESIVFKTTHLSLYGIGYSAPSEKFTDVSGYWAEKSIDYVVGKGILSGMTENTFMPNIAMTRGMLVSALGKLSNIDTKDYTSASFNDVKEGSDISPYIEWAFEENIIHGVGNGNFEPDRAVTREEIALIIGNYAEATGFILPSVYKAKAFADASDIGSAYEAGVAAMQKSGVMMGNTENMFNPKASVTRAEISSMLQRYINLTINPATAIGWTKNNVGKYLYCKDGKALTAEQTIDGIKYFFNSDGTLKTGWVKDEEGKWRFYLENNMLVGLCDVEYNNETKQYYFEDDGAMVSDQWIEFDGNWYYFNSDGSLAKDTKVDDYEVDENGARIEE